MALFPPSDIGFYVAAPTGDRNERGKRKYSYVDERRPATADDYRRHLRGEFVLTMPPLRRDARANFAAIDIDDYPLDQAKRAQLVAPSIPDGGYLLLHVRSASGGGHDFRLLLEPVEADVLVRSLRAHSKEMGDPERTEIFPKQVMFDPERDALPNGIKLPMSGGDYSECIAYDHLGDPLRTLDEFLRYAETKQIKVNGGVDAEDEADEPGGRKTRALTRRRTPKQNEGRNGFLFSLACKERAKGTPEDEALALVLDLNARADPYDHPNFSEGPLEKRDVRAMVKRVYRRYPEGSESVTDDSEELVARLNEEIAVIPLGGDLRILWEKRPDGLLGEERYSNRHQRPVEYLKVSAARGLLAPYSCVVSEGRRPVKRSAFDVWYESPKRREYDGLVFAPGREREVGSRTYNLFRGWCVEPRAGSCELQVRHVREVLADGDPEVAHFILSFLADVVQHPGDKMPVALALIGESGTGKSALGEMMKRILGQHMFTVSDPAHVSGRFNKHLATLLLLHAEEGAIWAGDPSAVGKLRDFVSRQTMPLESKGVDTVEIESHARLLLTTEDEQAVRASRRERRFACFRVSDAKRGKREYFRELFAEITSEAGAGTAAFLHFLLHYKYDRDAVLRSVPETEILNDQKLASMKPQETWLQDLLDSGFLPGDWEGTGASPTYVVFNHYVRHTGKLGKNHRAGETSLGKFLKKALAGRVRKSEVTRGEKRMNFYYFPSLEEARAEFDRYMSRGRTEWGSPTTWIANGKDDASGDDSCADDGGGWDRGGDDLP